jgi:hypothetical protein
LIGNIPVDMLRRVEKAVAFVAELEKVCTFNNYHQKTKLNCNKKVMIVLKMGLKQAEKSLADSSRIRVQRSVNRYTRTL